MWFSLNPSTPTLCHRFLYNFYTCWWNPWCYHSKETSLAELLHSAAYSYSKKVQLSFEFIFGCPLFGVKGLTSSKDAFGIAYPSWDANHVQAYLAMRLPCHLISSHQSLLHGSNNCHPIPVWKIDSFSLSMYKCIWLTLITVLICRRNNGAWRYPYSWKQFRKSPSVVCGGCEWNEASWWEHQVFLKQIISLNVFFLWWTYVLISTKCESVCPKNFC